MNSKGLSEIMKLIQEQIFKPIIILLYSTAILLFFWGLFEFMWSMQNEKSDKRDDGKRHMMYGILGLVIMLSVKGIIMLIANFIGADSSLPVNIQ